jgi:hypothetical protein
MVSFGICIVLLILLRLRSMGQELRTQEMDTKYEYNENSMLSLDVYIEMR